MYETTPSPTKVISNEQLREQTRERAETRRAEIIRDINKDRPEPKLVVEYTPTGSIVKEVRTAEGIRKNQETDDKIRAYKQQIERARGRAKDSFNRSR